MTVVTYGCRYLQRDVVVTVELVVEVLLDVVVVEEARVEVDDVVVAVIRNEIIIQIK